MDQILKIVHIITRLILGGAQENTLITCKLLAERGHDVTLITGPAIGPEGELFNQAKNEKSDTKKLDLLWEIGLYSRAYHEIENFVKYLFSRYTMKKVGKLSSTDRTKLEQCIWGALQKNPVLNQWNKQGFFMEQGKKHSLSKFKVGFMMNFFYKVQKNFDFKSEYKLALKGSDPDLWIRNLLNIIKKIWGLASKLTSEQERKKLLKGVGKAYSKWLKFEKKGEAKPSLKNDLLYLVKTLKLMPSLRDFKVSTGTFHSVTLDEMVAKLGSMGANHIQSQHRGTIGKTKRR